MCNEKPRIVGVGRKWVGAGEEKNMEVLDWKRERRVEQGRG